MSPKNRFRRIFLQTAGILGASSLVNNTYAHHTESHFDEQSAHRLVYQCNKSDQQYLGAILFSCGEMLRKYGDDIELVVTAIGPGLQLLGKNPTVTIDEIHQQRVTSLAQYGVAFHACGNTMDFLNWTEDDLLEFVSVVPIGADDLMQLQEQGFAYISW